MADAKETLFAQFTLLNYLQQSSTARTVKEILNHLQQNTDWGQSQLAKGLPDGGLRNVQNWLKNLRDSAEFSQQIEWEEDPCNRKQLQYKSKLPVVGNNSLSIEQACLLLLAEKYLDAALPLEFYDASLQDLFSQAKSTLAQYEKRPRHAKRAVKSYLERVAIVQRGQQLDQQLVPYEVLGVLSKAILDNKCVELLYKSRIRMVHPYAIVIREPKVYLLAVDDKGMAKHGPEGVEPIQYLCSRIDTATVSSRPNRVPNGFSADAYIAKGGLENGFRQQLSLSERSFTLKLRIHSESGESLLQDLREYPLSQAQAIIREPGTENHILSAPRMRASYHLVEWILGRMERVEVLSPVSLRDYIGSRIEVMHRLYNHNG